MAGAGSLVLVGADPCRGRGGLVLQETTDDAAKAFEITLRCTLWIEFEAFPVMTTKEEAFPIIQHMSADTGLALLPQLAELRQPGGET